MAQYTFTLDTETWTDYQTVDYVQGFLWGGLCSDRSVIVTALYAALIGIPPPSAGGRQPANNVQYLGWFDAVATREVAAAIPLDSIYDFARRKQGRPWLQTTPLTFPRILLTREIGLQFQADDFLTGFLRSYRGQYEETTAQAWNSPTRS